MADSSPNQSRPGSDPSVARGTSNASVPPSEPRGSRASFEALDAQVDRPARLQMIVALILGLVLVAIPLYLWRRPRAESIAIGTGTADAAALPAVTAAATPVVDDKLVLSEPKVMTCGDPSPKKVPCDRVPELESAFAKAIEDSIACVPRDAGGGTIIYVADVAFKKRSVAVSTPKEGRTLKSSRVATSCEKAVKSKLARAPLQSMKHDHGRYRLSITATYPGSVKP